MRSVIQLPLIVIVWCASVSVGVCQYPLGNSDAIVLDMKLAQGKQLLIANLGESIEVWNYQSKTFVRRWKAPKIVAMDYRNGKVVGASVTGSVAVWDLETGAVVLEKNVAGAPLIAVAWLDDGYFAVSGENKSILKIDAVTGEVVSKAAHTSFVTALALGSGNMLIAGDDRGTIMVYDAGSMTMKNSVKGHSRFVRQIVASDSTQIFFTAADDGKFRRWDAKLVKTTFTKYYGNWLLAADFADYTSQSQSTMTAIGKRNGELAVYVALGTYRADLKVMINDVEIIRGTLPDIIVAVATHGNGIQLWEAKEMKMK
jgi:WD40 repeat protein